MGAGKTTIGKKLARKLGFTFYDLDKAFEHKYKTTVDLFFHKYGEDVFRRIEHDMLVSTFTLNNTVISTGGGTPCFLDGMELINQNGTSIYIKLSPEALFRRLTAAKKRRPLVAKKSEEELKSFIIQKLTERETCYSKASITISGISLQINELTEILAQDSASHGLS
jgi:shikimate kinase